MNAQSKTAYYSSQTSFTKKPHKNVYNTQYSPVFPLRMARCGGFNSILCLFKIT